LESFLNKIASITPAIIHNYLEMATILTSDPLVIGVPGRVVGDVRPEQREFWEWGTRLYQGLPARCQASLRRIEL
jgi:hypothetical protein